MTRETYNIMKAYMDSLIEFLVTQKLTRMQTNKIFFEIRAVGRFINQPVK